MLAYFLKVNVAIVLFYAFYRLFFYKDTFFGWRRTALLCFFAVSAAELVVYAAFSIGYSFNKHKTLWTTILVLVFFQLAQFTAIAMIGAFFSADPTRWMYLDVYSAPASIELLLLWGMLGELLFCAIGYAVTWYFTTKKLNLE